LLEDVDKSVRNGTVKVRPESVRVPLAKVEEEVSWVQRGQGERREIILASCPARIGDIMDVMQRVTNYAKGYDNGRVQQGKMEPWNAAHRSRERRRIFSLSSSGVAPSVSGTKM
jgi:hypothetical protein